MIEIEEDNNNKNNINFIKDDTKLKELLLYHEVIKFFQIIF